MSGGVRFVFPKLKLEQLIHAPGGVAVADALAAADANLLTLKPTCHDELMALLCRAEALVAAPGLTGDETLAQLYPLAACGIGAGAVCGAPDVDVALNSLCDLIDGLQTAGGFDREALAVHLRAWRFLMDPNLPKPAAAAILEGLGKVVGHLIKAEVSGTA